jgi:hypothetical protein
LQFLSPLDTMSDPTPAAVESIPIRYFLVERSGLRNRVTTLHLLNGAEVPLLRCVMTILLMPAETGGLLVGRPPFAAAVNRLHRLPTFRKIGDDLPPLDYWVKLESAPFLILMVAGALPKWFGPLVEQRDIGILTQSESVLKAVEGISRVHAGLLKGMDDLREAYRVIRELADAAAKNKAYDEPVRSHCGLLAGADLFAGRSRLGFIPPIPLPQPAEGRPAVYLLNRLSNNLDEPSILPGAPPGGVTIFPQMLEWSEAACAALAYLELRGDTPSELPI